MRTPIKALLWKEARESSLYAGSAALLFTILALTGVPGLRGFPAGPVPPWNLGQYPMIAVAVALVFGYTQMNRESREMWSFALHRPVSGVYVFGAKLVIGTAALLLAIGVPYVASLWWLSLPGVRPVPFDRAYWLPVVVNLSLIVTWYVAGLYAGAWQRGSMARLTGVPVALLAASIARLSPSFWLALLSTAAVTAVLAVAACSEFLSGSDFESQSRWGRRAVVASAGYAVAAVFAVIAVAFGWLPMEHLPADAETVSEGLAVTHDGTIVRVKAADLPDRSGVYVSRAVATERSSIYSMENLTYNDSRRWVAPLVPAGAGTGFVMYYERRSGLISIYDDSTGAFRRWIGPSGVSTTRAKPSRRFAGYLQTNPIHFGMAYGPLVLSGGYYDLGGPTGPVRLRFAPPAGEELLAVGQAVGAGSGSPEEPEPWGNFMVMTTDKRIYVVDEQDVVRFSSAYTEGERGRPVRIIRFGDPASRGTLLWYGPRDAGDTVNHVVEVAESGAPVRSFQVAGVLVPGVPEPWTGKGESTRLPPLAPLRVMPAFEAVYATLYMEGSAQRVRIAVLICLLSGALTLLLCRLYGLEGRRVVAWTALGTVTGPIAPAVMLLLLEWPARGALAARAGAGAGPAWSAT